MATSRNAPDEPCPELFTRHTWEATMVPCVLCPVFLIRKGPLLHELIAVWNDGSPYAHSPIWERHYYNARGFWVMQVDSYTKA